MARRRTRGAGRRHRKSPRHLCRRHELRASKARSDAHRLRGGMLSTLWAHHSARPRPDTQSAPTQLGVHHAPTVCALGGGLSLNPCRGGRV